MTEMQKNTTAQSNIIAEKINEKKIIIVYLLHFYRLLHPEYTKQLL